MTENLFEQLQIWLTDYLVKILASIGAVLGLISIYRIVSSGTSMIFLVPALAVQIFPFVLLFRRKISMATQRKLISGAFMLAILAAVFSNGLVSNYMLFAPFLMLSLIIFHGRRGFIVCLSFLVFSTLVATAIDLHNGFSTIEMNSNRGIMMRAVNLGVIMVIVSFAFRGFYLLQEAQEKLFSKQADTIDRQQFDILKHHERADLANQNLTLLENTLNCLVLTIDFDGEITFRNKYAISVLGDVKQGQSCFDISLDTESSAAFSRALKLAITGESIDQFSFRLADSRGETLNFVAACSSRLDLSGRPIDMVMAATDVTELRKQRDRLRNLGKLEAVGLACARIAHDFANLLMIIEANLELLDKRSLDPKGETQVENAIKAVRDSVTLTKQIGEFSSTPQIKRKSIKLCDFMAHLYANSQTLCPDRLQVNSDWSFFNETIEIDDTHFNIVILNLVANARDAISDEGDITIRARLNRSGERGKATFCIDVIDTGHGIPEENIDKVTEPFFSTKNLKTGMGLGLSTSMRLIEEMGGVMTISSREISGTKVSVNLPVDVTA